MGMAQWVKAAERILMIDGCFLQCHGRVLRKLVGEDKVIQVDALPFYRKYTDIFLMDDPSVRSQHRPRPLGALPAL